MRTFSLAFCVVLAAHTVVSAQPLGDEQSGKVHTDGSSLRLRPSYSEYDLRMPKYEPRLHYQIGSDGRVQIFSSQAEADRKLQKQREEEKVRTEAMKSYADQQQAQANKRAEDAEWKLGAIVLGLFVGLIRVIWGICSNKG